MKQPLIIITGPTAAGKTGLSIAVAKAIGGEIISADSMQVYRGMDIGTAKITHEAMEGVRHHLIDVLEPDESCSVATFQKLVKEAIDEIAARGNIPVIVGGTGFYIDSIVYDTDFSTDQGPSPYRQELELLATKEDGPAGLYRKLAEVDPDSLKTIHENNVKRVIRALEYYEQTGEPISAHNARERLKKSPYEYLYYCLTMPREILYDRINMRVDQMVEAGLVEEVRNLLDKGYSRDLVSMQGLGYKEIVAYLEGEMTLIEAVDILKRDTRRFAKRQLTWFRRHDDIRWVDLSSSAGNLYPIVKNILKDVEDLKKL